MGIMKKYLKVMKGVTKISPGDAWEYKQDCDAYFS